MIVAATDAIVSVDSSLNKTNRCLQSLDVLELSERKSEAVPVVEHTAIFSGAFACIKINSAVLYTFVEELYPASKYYFTI